MEARIEISPDVKAMFIAVAAIIGLTIGMVVALNAGQIEFAFTCLAGIGLIAGVKLAIDVHDGTSKNGRNGNGKNGHNGN